MNADGYIVGKSLSAWIERFCDRVRYFEEKELIEFSCRDKGVYLSICFDQRVV